MSVTGGHLLDTDTGYWPLELHPLPLRSVSFPAALWAHFYPIREAGQVTQPTPWGEIISDPSRTTLEVGGWGGRRFQEKRPGNSTGFLTELLPHK